MVFIEKFFLNIKYVLNNYGWQPSCGYIFKFFILLFTLNKYTVSHFLVNKHTKKLR